MNIVSELAKKLEVSEWEITRFLANAPKKYKVYSIPKRTHGHRIIAQPSKDLKIYQRAFLDSFASYFPVHPAAMAYREGVSIKDNAIFHSQHSYILKMDFENFFNSINKQLFWSVWLSVHKNLPNSSDKKAIERIVFWQPNKKNKDKLILSIGAPTSPWLSNFCMYFFDEMITEFCIKEDIAYTRYADDITFSTSKKNVLFGVPAKVQSILKDCFGLRLTVNHSKTAFSSKAHNRHVTGLTITNDSKISLGRERKRYIKHLVHQFLLGNLDNETIGYLQGMISFVKHVEPVFLDSLQRKYPKLSLCDLFEAKNEEN